MWAWGGLSPALGKGKAFGGLLSMSDWFSLWAVVFFGSGGLGRLLGYEGSTTKLTAVLMLLGFSLV